MSTTSQAKAALARLKDRTSFAPGLRFELCYALSLLVGGPPEVHPAWQRAARAALPERLFRLAGSVLANPFLWVLLPDALSAYPLETGFEPLLANFRTLSARDLQAELIHGTFHEPRVVAAILERGAPVHDALALATPAKREWLTYVGLYPYDRDQPVATALDQLLRQPEAFKELLATVLETFWNTVFRATWESVQAQYAASIAACRSASARLPLPELFESLKLRVVVDTSRGGRLRALRGDYSIAADRVDELVLIPSAFNRELLWSVLEHDGTTRVYCPYLDPSIAVMGGPRPSDAGPRPDAALLLRALGDTTRYALAMLLARRSHTASELARALAVSKPTISHHIALLREAGLIEEQVIPGGTRLALRRPVLEGLSDLVVGALYSDGPLPALSRSRRKG